MTNSINKKNSYIVYARSSSDNKEQRNRSLQEQIDKCNKIVKRRKLVVKDVLTDTKPAAKPNTRPAFKEMLRRVQTGEANSIICFSLDRLTRNKEDLLKLQQMLNLGSLKSLVVVTGERIPDCEMLPLGYKRTKNSIGFDDAKPFVASIFANYDSMRRSERAKVAKQKAKCN
ncbi:MAG: recombinase family protein [Candidatus Nanoarchaeia archaeon]|jgi:predicted site-specific integrase-resolvase|nr:recombinase family protein [Candidatus Nanoarchaeia archaeon]